MKYYPLSRVITGSRASGTDFTLNGVPYMGPYYKTFDGRYLTGNDPVTGKSEALVSTAGTMETRTQDSGYKKDSIIRVDYTANPESFIPINPFYPKPSEADYNRGFFFRYFAKKRNENRNLIETNKEVYDSLQHIGSPYNYELHQCIQLYWQLTGPLKDTINPTNGVRTAGIENTNKRLVEMKEPIFGGLYTFIGENYSKFAKPVA